MSVNRESTNEQLHFSSRLVAYLPLAGGVIAHSCHLTMQIS
ncbi:hypothetical protein M5585_14985 [Serratia ureilytica]